MSVFESEALRTLTYDQDQTNIQLWDSRIDYRGSRHGVMRLRRYHGSG